MWRALPEIADIKFVIAVPSATVEAASIAHTIMLFDDAGICLQYNLQNDAATVAEAVRSLRDAGVQGSLCNSSLFYTCVRYFVNKTAKFNM